MNWGNKLIIVFVVFAGLMSYMVYRCVQAPVDLVTSEYYRDELAYQQIIDGTKNANALSSKMILLQDNANITIQFPQEMKNQIVKGNILFYCAADSKKDRQVVIQLDEFGKQRLPAKSFLTGNYIVKATWENNGNSFYSEEPFTIY